jgi:hypothetical protein
MPESNFDYDPKKDKLPKKITFWIIVVAIAMAIYLSTILV